jgi:hypothetical protein
LLRLANVRTGETLVLEVGEGAEGLRRSEDALRRSATGPARRAIAPHVAVGRAARSARIPSRSAGAARAVGGRSTRAAIRLAAGTATTCRRSSGASVAIQRIAAARPASGVSTVPTGARTDPARIRLAAAARKRDHARGSQKTQCFASRSFSMGLLFHAMFLRQAIASRS